MANKHDKTASTIAQNKKARFDYFIEERIEAGIALQGWEVKSMRAGKAQLVDSYVILRDGEAWLLGSHVSPAQHRFHARHRRPDAYPQAADESAGNRSSHGPRRAQGLHAHRAGALLEQESRKAFCRSSERQEATRQARDRKRPRLGARQVSCVARALTRFATFALATVATRHKLAVHLGATWLRRGSRNLRGMPRCRIPRKTICKRLVANDDNYALAA